MTPSSPFRVAAAQVACVSADVEANLDTCLAAIEEARAAGADLVVFPELALTGAELEGRVLDVARTLDSPELGRVREASAGLTVAIGFVEEAPGPRFFNSVATFDDGRLVHVHRKLYLVSYGVFSEGRLFAAGDTVDAFDTRLGRMATPICEDTWHVPVPYLAALDGAWILVTCAGSPEGLITKAAPSRDLWRAVVRSHALTFGCFHVFVNRAGPEGSLRFWGGSTVIGPSGEILAVTESSEPGLVLAELDPAAVRQQRAAAPFLRDERVELTLRELDRIARKRLAPVAMSNEGEMG